MATANIPNQVASKASQEIHAYDFQQAGSLNETHVQALAGLHEALVRNLTAAFCNSLRTTFELKLVGVEEIPFAKLVPQISANAYVASVLFQPQHTLGAIQMDTTLVFPMLDLMLGGNGNSPAPARGLTDIEEYLMQDVVRWTCIELERTWKSLDMSVTAGERQKPAQLPKLLLPNEKVLLLRLNGKLQEAEGALNILLPAGTAAAMLRKLFKLTPLSARPAAPSAAQRIQERLLDCFCDLELTIPGIKVFLSDILYLEAGKMLDLGVPVTTPALLSLEGQEWFEAFPVRAGSFRAARLGHHSAKRSHNG